MSVEASGESLIDAVASTAFSAAKTPEPAWSPGYLVVDDHVDSAVSRVGRQVTQVEGLVHDALAGKRSIPVQKDGHDLQTCKGDPKCDMVLTTTSTRHTGDSVTIHFSKNDVF